MPSATSKKNYPQTPDGRYFVAKSQLWRKTDPRLDDAERRAHVKTLMRARLAVRNAGDAAALRAARAEVDRAKIALGERGPVWWDDGEPDQTRRHPKNSSYADWWRSLSESERRRGE